MDLLSSERPELFWLTLSALTVSLVWVPHIVQIIAQEGLVRAVWDPVRETPHRAAWARRSQRAHRNAVESIAAFAPLALIVVLTGNATPATALASMVFFFARLGHYLAYVCAIPIARVALFLVGWGATVTLAVSLA